jgi:ABC-type transport system involved in multi-copper enzyme maturation permease subunit
MVLAVLPPIYELPDMIPALVQHGSVDTNSILWLLGYSAICFVVGLIVLKRRPFA